MLEDPVSGSHLGGAGIRASSAEQARASARDQEDAITHLVQVWGVLCHKDRSCVAPDLAEPTGGEH